MPVPGLESLDSGGTDRIQKSFRTSDCPGIGFVVCVRDEDVVRIVRAGRFVPVARIYPRSALELYANPAICRRRMSSLDHIVAQDRG